MSSPASTPSKVSLPLTPSSRPRSRRRQETVVEPEPTRPVTAEDRRLAMLGKQSSSDPMFSREEFCGSCGTEHVKPELMDIYSMCKSCFNSLREPYHLRKRYENIEQVVPLEIFIATYGDPLDPLRAYDVTEICRKRVNDMQYRDRIAFKSAMALDEIFGFDPVPNKNKQLRIRYRMSGVFATLVLDVTADNHVPSAVILMVPRSRYLNIVSAHYGHPKGMSATGRMSYDVTEIIQGYVDMFGGSYIDISTMTPITKMLGDPCPGYPKDLRIEYEVCGRDGVIIRDETRGHLKKRIFLEESPTVAPLIFVTSALYGITPMGRSDRLKAIDKELKAISVLEHRIREGESITGAVEVQRMSQKATLLEERRLFRDIGIHFIDITAKMQKIVDKCGANVFIDHKCFDPNFTFGNPIKGVKKLLEVNLACNGHDSEKYTDSKDMTASGHPRNFIINKNGRFVIVVNEFEDSTSAMAESLQFIASTSSPIIYIARASYGIFSDTTKLIDVTMEVQTKVKGRILNIERTDNLQELFSKDPSPGARKQLRVDYVTRGFCGNLRIPVRNDLLVAGVQLGYPPVPPADDADS